MTTQIARADGVDVTIDLPLFWYDPPWCHVASERADILATAVGLSNVLVSAMRSDLAGPDREPKFHAQERRDAEHDEAEGSRVAIDRIVPYRPERYGLSVADLDSAKVIDVRLTMTRDAFGRFAFSPSQIERWEATPTSEPLAGGGWVPAATFPPDVVSIKHLSQKFDQLRRLSPQAAVLASIFPYRIEEELPDILAAQPDGLILRLDEMTLDGLQLAAVTQRARKMMNEAGASSVPLWIVPGAITPDDAVKLISLGASAIAVDDWCDPLVAEAAQLQQSTFSRLGYSAPSHGDEEYLYQLAQHQLTTRIERFKGLTQSLRRVPPTQRLGSYDTTWARTLDVKPLS